MESNYDVPLVFFCTLAKGTPATGKAALKNAIISVPMEYSLVKQAAVAVQQAQDKIYSAKKNQEAIARAKQELLSDDTPAGKYAQDYKFAQYGQIFYPIQDAPVKLMPFVKAYDWLDVPQLTQNCETKKKRPKWWFL